MESVRLRLRSLRDVRLRALVLTALVIALGGGAIAVVSDRDYFDGFFPGGALFRGRQDNVINPARQEIHQRFQQGVVMLHARQHEHAMTAFHRVLELDPAMPEAHVNMGYALVGLQRYGAARDFFEGALALRREQANAYYGLAVALDGLHDRPGAIGAMRTFVHLANPEDPFVRKAQAALWEWESERAAAGRTPVR